MNQKLHQYPKNRSSGMKAVSPGLLGSVRKATTTRGPHLKSGHGTAFQQMAITDGFTFPASRTGHTQKVNLTKLKPSK